MAEIKQHAAIIDECDESLICRTYVDGVFYVWVLDVRDANKSYSLNAAARRDDAEYWESELRKVRGA